jgi:hypothetical protein
MFKNQAVFSNLRRIFLKRCGFFQTCIIIFFSIMLTEHLKKITSGWLKVKLTSYNSITACYKK